VEYYTRRDRQTDRQTQTDALRPTTYGDGNLRAPVLSCVAVLSARRSQQHKSHCIILSNATFKSFFSIHPASTRSARLRFPQIKGKGSPYSITERRVPQLIPVLGSQPAGDVSHKPGGSLPLPQQPLRWLLPISLLGEQRHNGCEQFA